MGAKQSKPRHAHVGTRWTVTEIDDHIRKGSTRWDHGRLRLVHGQLMIADHASRLLEGRVQFFPRFEHVLAEDMLRFPSRYTPSNTRTRHGYGAGRSSPDSDGCVALSDDLEWAVWELVVR